jgi:hypothetical protein
LPKGVYELEVIPQGQSSRLRFSLQGQTKAAVVSLPANDSDAASARLPLVGAHYLRSTAKHLETAQERQHSKTGRAQYEEEDRDWDAVLRVYKSSDNRRIYFVFQSRGKSRKWSRSTFELSAAPHTAVPLSNR